MPGRALATTKYFENRHFFILNVSTINFYGLEWNVNPSHPLNTMCQFELRACKYRFDIENELLYIFQALIYSTHRFKKVQIN